MPVHHRLRFLTFPMRTSRLCSLWPDMRRLRFRRVPFGRDVAFDPGGATASRIAMPHMLPFDGSERLGLRKVTSFVAQSPTPSDHCVRFASAVADDCATLASRRCATAYRGRSFTGRIASASPDAPELEVRIHLPPAESQARTR